MGDPCFLESIPGIAFCNINKTDVDGVSNLGNNNSEADGSVSLQLTEDIPSDRGLLNERAYRKVRELSSILRNQ